ncbi:MAG: SDR family NAD(P)-dependent oxidoreductase [Chloroflexi bacterium]|nr:SDR family NAD(P)-dependent oxidoreductase [Chloroflexota bacterium]
MKDIRGCNAIVTGASRGIGPYIARTLAREGVNLVLAARDAAKLEETRVACEALGVRAISVATDVTLDSDRRRLVEAALRSGQIDILVNNAGVEYPGTLTELTFDEVDGILETNLRAPVHLSKLVVPGMLERKRGAIVHVSSMAGKGGAPYNSIYSTTKFGLQGLVESMQFELDGTGVHMATVCPGFVSEAGMWMNRGGKAPRMMREVSPQKVADGVLKAIRGAREVLVVSGPIRPLLALNQLFPGLQKPIIKRMGVDTAMRGHGPEKAAVEEERETADIG